LQAERTSLGRPIATMPSGRCRFADPAEHAHIGAVLVPIEPRRRVERIDRSADGVLSTTTPSVSVVPLQSDDPYRPTGKDFPRSGRQPLSRSGARAGSRPESVVVIVASSLLRRRGGPLPQSACGLLREEIRAVCKEPGGWQIATSRSPRKRLAEWQGGNDGSDSLLPFVRRRFPSDDFRSGVCSGRSHCVPRSPSRRAASWEREERGCEARSNARRSWRP
jgi:hypothetical protein